MLLGHGGVEVVSLNRCWWSDLTREVVSLGRLE